MLGSMVLQKRALRVNCTFQLDIYAAFEGSQSPTTTIKETHFPKGM